MSSFRELIANVKELKNEADQLSTMISAAGDTAIQNSNNFAIAADGKQSAMSAAVAMSAAAKSLKDSAAKLKTLSRTCDNCLKQLSD